MALPSHRFDLIRVKIERAEQHIQDLNAAIDTFFLGKPYEVGTKSDPQTRELIYYMVRVENVPLSIAAICGDALQNLRTALDHLASQLVSTAGGGERSDSAAFPIGASAKKYKAMVARKVEGMGQRAKNAIDAVEPYEGGKGDVLWRLHALNNIDKHRLLLTVASTYDFHSITPSGREHFRTIWHGSHGDEPFPAMREVFVAPGKRIFPLKAGDEILRVPEAEINEDMKFLVDVAFNESGIVEGKSVLETLQGMANAVNNLLSDFAALL